MSPIKIKAVLRSLLVAAVTVALPLSASAMQVVSERTSGGLAFPESVVYDPEAKVLYASEFGGTELKPGEKDGKGYIAKVSLEGKVLEERFLPAAGVIMNKPKGLWVKGHRLWVTDIDGVWVFDTKTKEGKKVMIPGAQFANDPALVGDTLYVSDNRADQLYSIAPADFLKGPEPKIATVWSGKNVNPNGVYPAHDGGLLLAGFKSDKEPKGIYHMAKGSTEPKAISKDIGRLDGLYEMQDGTLIVTDWNTGSVFTWSEKGGMTTIAKDFKGPADLCAFPHDGGLMVVVPDLVQSQLRFIQLK